MASPLTSARVAVRDRVVGRRGMTRAMRANTRAIAETLFTTSEGPPPTERLDWLVEEADDFVAQAGARARFVLWLCMTAISLLAPIFALRLALFRWLAHETRIRALERMERSALGLAVFGAKAILCILYYEHPDSARFVGFDGLCLED